jgi:hypothetical protein
VLIGELTQQLFRKTDSGIAQDSRPFDINLRGANSLVFGVGRRCTGLQLQDVDRNYRGVRKV